MLFHQKLEVVDSTPGLISLLQLRDRSIGIREQELLLTRLTCLSCLVPLVHLLSLALTGLPQRRLVV